MSKKRRPVVLDDPAPIMRSVTIAVMASAAILGAMILFNAFFGQGQVAVQDLADVPEGATTRSVVSVGGKSSRTVTLKYDETIEEVQRELLSAGYFQGLVDGVSGPKTREAIAAYQRDKSLAVTGNISQELLDHLRYARKLEQAAKYTGSLEAPARQVVVGTDDPEPDVADIAPAVPKNPNVLKAQLALTRLGYATGSTSGRMDEGTRAAVLAFAMDNGLSMDGEVTKPFLGELSKALKRQAAR